MDIEDFQMQLIEFKASLLWVSKFVDLRKSLEATENPQTNILTCWKSLPEKFDCLKKMAIALLSAFGSTYLREQMLSHEVYSQSSSQPTYGQSFGNMCSTESVQI